MATMNAPFETIVRGVKHFAGWNGAAGLLDEAALDAVVYTVAIEDLDAAGVIDISDDIEKLAASDASVVIDVENVEFCDSSGIGAIVYVLKRVSSRGHTLSIRNAHGQPLKLLTMLRLHHLIAR